MFHKFKNVSHFVQSKSRKFCTLKNNRLEGKVALVTGAAQGIGKSTALLFANSGAKVIATDINSSLLSELSHSENIITKVLDVTNRESINKVKEELKTDGMSINILFNCAGYVHNGTILDCNEEDWEKSFSVNVTSIYRMVHTFLPQMIEMGSGSIINIASVASSIKGVNNRFAYASSKAAIIGLTKSIAIDYIKHGIRCNAICPGTIHTPSLEERIQSSPDPKKAREAFISRQPMGRLGTAEEISHLSLYLANDLESSFTTGSIFIVDGGFTI
eukprot:TRINITY_DN11257_c0_g1_i1.p1 TRINITY_DN11257_c0_g1~~TRINITY_DN11257_c0_g1_i1.p1  ORF type:complete len:274 (-),score=48.25 TRINITY_DN11257_c0_g1_i1:41-862(-)